MRIVVAYQKLCKILLFIIIIIIIIIIIEDKCNVFSQTFQF